MGYPTAHMSERKRPVLAPPKSKATSTTAAVNTLEVTTKAVVSSPAVEDKSGLKDNVTIPVVDSPPPRRKHHRVHHQHHHLHEQKSLPDVGEDGNQATAEGQRSRGSTLEGGSMVDSMWKWWKEDSMENMATVAVDTNPEYGPAREWTNRLSISTANSPFTDEDNLHPSEAMAALKDAASGKKKNPIYAY